MTALLRNAQHRVLEKGDKIVHLSLVLIFFGFPLFDSRIHRGIMFLAAPFWIAAAYRSSVGKMLTRDGAAHLLLLFYAFALASLLWSRPIDFEWAGMAMLGLVFGPLFLLMLMRFDDRSQIDSLINYYIAGTVVSVTIALAVHLAQGDGLHERFGLLWRGRNPNVAGFFLGFALLSAIATAYGKPFISIGRTAVLALLIAGLVLTQSRSALFGVVLALAVVLALCRSQGSVQGREHGTGKLYAIGALVAILAAVLISHLTLGSDRLLSPYDATRLELWTKTIDMIKDRPIFGAGMGGAFEVTVEGAGTFNHAHNVWLGTLFHLGIVGTAIFLVVVLMLLRHGYAQARDHGDALPIGILTYGIVVGLFEFQTVIVHLHREWLIWLLPTALYLQKRNR